MSIPGFVIFNFMIYAIINAFTPGSGNFLALNTVTNYGLKRGKPLFFGIFAGYYFVQTSCCVFVYALSSLLPQFLAVMKYIGAAYILWLAIHIAISKPGKAGDEKSASFWKGFALQFVNVNIYLFGITALTGFITDYSRAFPVLFLFEMIIATVGTIATATWIGLGMMIQKFYEKHFRIINIIMALTLLECIYSMLVS